MIILCDQKLFFLWGMCKVVVKITKRLGKSVVLKEFVIITKKKVLELWLKMGDIEIKLDHWNLCDVVLRRIRKMFGEKRRDITEEEKQRFKTFFKVKKVIFITEKVAIDVIERC